MSEDNGITERSSNQEKKSTNPIIVVLMLIMFGLSGYVVYLWMDSYKDLERQKEFLENSYSKQNNDYQKMLRQMTVIKKEFNLKEEFFNERESELETEVKKISGTLSQEKEQHSTTRTVLAKTEEMLVAVKADKEELEKSIKALEKIRDEQTEKSIDLENKIVALKQKNDVVANEMSDLKLKLAQYNTDVSNLSDGKDVIRFFKNKIREVKQKVHQIKVKTYNARVEAQREKDRLEALAGNNGYLLKDGEWADPIPDYNAASVNIDVKFVQ